MSLTKEQQALALASMCNTQDSENPSCPARVMFQVECPFNTRKCFSVSENDWLDALENDFSCEAHMYRVTIGINFTVRKSLMALSPRTAKSQAEADIRKLLGEANLLENAKITVEDCNKEDK